VEMGSSDKCTSLLITVVKSFVGQICVHEVMFHSLELGGEKKTRQRRHQLLIETSWKNDYLPLRGMGTGWKAKIKTSKRLNYFFILWDAKKISAGPKL
jgi:hypothetical protein